MSESMMYLMSAGTTPTLTSEKVNVADLTTMRKSVQNSRPNPPPIAGPFTRAIVGFEQAKKFLETLWVSMNGSR